MKKKIETKLKFILVIKNSTYFILIVTMLLMFSTHVYSVEIDTSEEALLFVGNEKIAPIIYKENNKVKGVVVDIVKELGKKIGRSVKVEAMNWEKAQNKVLSGEADALLQINPSPEREKLYDFSSELLKSEFSIFKKAKNININDIYDLNDKRVGIESVGYPFYLLEKYNNTDIVIIPDWISGFEMIDSGALDALVVDRWIGEYELAKSKVSEIQVIEQPIEIMYSRIAVREGNEELLNLINKGLEEMKNDGTMDQILSQWRGKKVVYFTEEELRRVFYYTVLGILILIILGAILLVLKLRRINRQLELKVTERTKELYEVNEQLRKMSMIDGLTNISNRRCFDDFFKKTWRTCLRKKLPLSLIVLDIDCFKQYNDNYGHLAGDYCLKSIANILKTSVKCQEDAVARFGGEEFIVMLFNTPEEGAMMFAEDIRKRIEKSVIIYEDNKTSVTASLGVATIIPNEDLNPIDLIEFADQAMYQAKNTGRNKTIMANL